MWEGLPEVYDSAGSLTRQLDYYHDKGVTTSNYSGAIKYNGTNMGWWLRSADSCYDYGFWKVFTSGYWYSNYSDTTTNGVSPAFRIAYKDMDKN